MIYMSQNATCQKANWALHRGRCSVLPAGELVPAQIEFGQAQADELEKAGDLCREIKWAVSVSLRPPLPLEVGGFKRLTLQVGIAAFPGGPVAGEAVGVRPGGGQGRVARAQEPDQ
jgi:hypothetical protein